jgi:RHS repeat-associated protein
LQEQLSYGYDAAGNLNQRTNNAFVQNFAVNNLNELTTLTRSGTLTVAGITTSAATNVTVNTSNAVQYADFTFAATNFALVDGTNTFTAIAKDILGIVATNMVSAYMPAMNNYVYDQNGNLITNGNQILNYDDENELTSVCVPNTWSNSYSYDGKFRRRIEKDFYWNGSAWMQTNEIHFIYDGNMVIQERGTNNNPLVTYTRVGSSLLARTDIGLNNAGSLLASAYYHADGNLNITCLIYTNQQIAAKYSYDSFGNMLSMSGPLVNANSYTFSSKEWNASSGLYYFGRRYYIPNVQRWLNRDPIGENGGLNLYRAMNNNPINNIDPLGLWNLWAPWTWGVSDGIGTSLGNSLNPFDGSAGWGGFSLETSSEADAAFLDGINPFGNPLANAGLYDPCDKSLQASRHIGTATGVVEASLLAAGAGAELWSAGLNGGDQSIFWSGYSQGARTIAESLGGTTLEQTPIGGALDFLSNTLNIPGLSPIWRAASATFAGNATSATAVILANGATWTEIELPILLENEIPIYFY